MKATILGLVVLRLLVIACVSWIGVSLFASLVRFKEDNCDKRYPLDRYVAADLFCPLAADASSCGPFVTPCNAPEAPDAPVLTPTREADGK